MEIKFLLLLVSTAQCQFGYEYVAPESYNGPVWGSSDENLEEG